MRSLLIKTSPAFVACLVIPNDELKMSFHLFTLPNPINITTITRHLRPTPIPKRQTSKIPKRRSTLSVKTPYSTPSRLNLFMRIIFPFKLKQQ